MASKTGGILHDQNLDIRFNEASARWKTHVSKAPSKRGAALAGRTPLGDLSNSLKPSMNRATRKQSSTLFSPLIEKEAVTSGIALDATKKKNTSKASLKQQPASRKALSDISNSGKPQVNVASKRNDKKCSAEASVGWKTNVSKSPSKRGAALAGRTPLGDLSNSLKPSMNGATRKQSSTLFSPLIEKEAVTSGIALDATKKKNTSKASLKQQPASRKALSDISNSGKPQVNVASKRNDKKCYAEASVGWKTNVSKAPSKRGAALAGRTPLGDLSNSLKPSMNRATRKQSSTLFSPLIEKEAVTSGIALDATKKKNTSKASLKQQPAVTLQSPSASFRFEIDLDDEFSTPEVHNHQECINARFRVMEMDRNHFLRMVLGPDHGNQKLNLQSPSASFRKEIDLDDEFHIPELLPECSDWYKPLASPPDSPFPEPEPDPDSPFPWWRQFEDVEFVLKQENDCFDTDSSI